MVAKRAYMEMVGVCGGCMMMLSLRGVEVDDIYSLH